MLSFCCKICVIVIFVILCCILSGIECGVQCLSNPCINGICIDDHINSTTYRCYCENGFTGLECETNWNECWSSPCKNNATCVDEIGTFRCECQSNDFAGLLCEIDLNACSSNPCQNNGLCSNTYGSFVCMCADGFSGHLCHFDNDVCSQPKCANNGTCIEGRGNAFSCICPNGWTGTICDQPIDQCESQPCQNGGMCLNYRTYYQCACPFTFYGPQCNHKLTFCSALENECENLAICVRDSQRNGISCYCQPDFYGEKCQFQYDDCNVQNCRNGGNCTDAVNGIRCECPDGFAGDFCQFVSSDPALVTLAEERSFETTQESIEVSTNMEQSNVAESNSTYRPVSYNFNGSNSGWSSFLELQLPQANFERICVHLNFCLKNQHDQISLILFAGHDRPQNNATLDHFAVTYVQGYLMLTWSIGYGPKRIFTKTPLKSKAGQIHRLHLEIRQNFGRLTIDNTAIGDDNENDVGLTVESHGIGQSLGMSDRRLQLKTNSKLFVGGYSSRYFDDLPHDLPKHSGFNGCISNVRVTIDNNNETVVASASALVLNKRFVTDCEN